MVASTISSCKKTRLHRIGSTCRRIASCPHLWVQSESACDSANGFRRTTDTFFDSFQPTLFPQLVLFASFVHLSQLVEEQHVFCHFNLWRELHGRGRVGKQWQCDKGLIQAARVLLTVTTGLSRRSVIWLSGSMVAAFFATSSMKERVNVAASCAAGTEERTVRFTKMAVGMESSDDEFGILEDERCIGTACCHPPPLRSHFSFTILTQTDWCALRTVCQMRSGSVAGCRGCESGCARDLTGALRGTLTLTSSPFVSEKLRGEPFASRHQVSHVVTWALGIWTDAMEKKKKLVAQPLLGKSGQFPRFCARPQTPGPRTKMGPTTSST